MRGIIKALLVAIASRKWGELLMSILITVMVLWMVWEAREWDLRARLFPVTIGVPASALALLQLAIAVRNVLAPEPGLAGGEGGPRQSGPTSIDQSGTVQPSSAGIGRPGDLRAEASASSGAGGDIAIVAAAVEETLGPGSRAAEEEELPPELVRRRVFEMVCWILLFTAGIVVLGFKVGAGVLTLAFMRFAARESWKTSIYVSLATYIFFYLLFDYWLHIPFNGGLIADRLGLRPLDNYVMDPVMDLFRGLAAGT